jgi:hypothetical protein
MPLVFEWRARLSLELDQKFVRSEIIAWMVDLYSVTYDFNINSHEYDD